MAGHVAGSGSAVKSPDRERSLDSSPSTGDLLMQPSARMVGGSQQWPAGKWVLMQVLCMLVMRGRMVAQCALRFLLWLCPSCVSDSFKRLNMSTSLKGLLPVTIT